MLFLYDNVTNLLYICSGDSGSLVGQTIVGVTLLALLHITQDSATLLHITHVNQIESHDSTLLAPLCIITSLYITLHYSHYSTLLTFLHTITSLYTCSTCSHLHYRHYTYYSTFLTLLYISHITLHYSHYFTLLTLLLHNKMTLHVSHVQPSALPNDLPINPARVFLGELFQTYGQLHMEDLPVA